MSMEHSEAVDLGQRIQAFTGYDMLVDSIGQDLNGRYVRMMRGPGEYQNFYSEAQWEQYKEAAGWQEQMHWRPQIRHYEEQE